MLFQMAELKKKYKTQNRVEKTPVILFQSFFNFFFPMGNLKPTQK